MISLGTSNGSCNSANDLSMRICVPSKTKDADVKVFNMITNKNEAKTMANHFICKCKLNSTTCNSNQKWNNETCQCECKNYCTCICQWLIMFIFIVLD